MKFAATLGAGLLLATSVQATTVSIQFAGETSGSGVTSVDAAGADFASAFSGQTVTSNIDLSGNPTGPLTLAPSGLFVVNDPSSPSVPPGLTIIPDPNDFDPVTFILVGAQDPMAILLDSDAISFSFTTGFQNGGELTVKFYGVLGGPAIHTETLALGGSQNGGLYSEYTVSAPSAFRGVTFDHNTDLAGLRYLNMSYETAPQGQVPEPASLMLLTAGLAGLGVTRRATGKR